MTLYQIVRSKGYKNFMAKLYGIGASIVIMGALFKILHFHGADLMLMLGMGTEAIIFFFSAFEPLHKEFNWALVYPELGIAEEPKKDAAKGNVTQQLDKMLSEAKIGPELIESLASGMRNLGDNAKKLSNTTDAVAATEGYVTNLSKAKDAVQNLTGVYEKSADAISSSSDAQVKNMQGIVDVQKQYAQKLQSSLTETADMQAKGVNEILDIQKQHAQKLQNSLTETANMQTKSVNEILDLQKQHAQKLQELQMQNVQKVGQIQDQGNQAILENYKKMQESAVMLANSMNESVQEAQKYKQEVDKLSKNVAQINSIYANMLAAMTNK
jgi:gliding motility-associated protein GldL